MKAYQNNAVNDDEQELCISDSDREDDEEMYRALNSGELYGTLVKAPASTLSVETAATDSEEVVVDGTFNRKYHDAARFWKPRPYFAKHYGFNRDTLATLRMIMLIPSGIDLITTANTNHVVWILTFYTFWGYFGSMLAILASCKAAEFQEWQAFACVMNQCATAMNLVINMLFWVLLAPSIFPGLDLRKPADLYTAFHMTTLHVIPIVQTTIQVVVTDMELVPEDWWHQFVLGFIYIFFNATGQYWFGTPLYPMTNWVLSPIGALGTLLTMATA